jgi:2-iminobutanoate/2-iminopropanoate deaminase
MLTHDRLFISTMAGIDPATGTVPRDPAVQVDLALDRLASVLQAAGLSNANMVYVNPYLTPDLSMRVMNEHYARRFEFGNTPARATIEVASLPESAQIAYTGVAVRDLTRRKAIRPKNMAPSPTASPCVFAGDTLYCSAKSGFLQTQMACTTHQPQTRRARPAQLSITEEADMNAIGGSAPLQSDDHRSAHWRHLQEILQRLIPQTTVGQLKPGDRKADEQGGTHTRAIFALSR